MAIASTFGNKEARSIGCLSLNVYPTVENGSMQKMMNPKAAEAAELESRGMMS
jgi:hypothetical protein